MFLYLMDGCDDWWKEIMQGPLLVNSFAVEKEESKAVALSTNKRMETSWLHEDAQQIEF